MSRLDMILYIMSLRTAAGLSCALQADAGHARSLRLISAVINFVDGFVKGKRTMLCLRSSRSSKDTFSRCKCMELWVPVLKLRLTITAIRK